MTTRKRKTFDPSVKLEVVKMIKEQGLSIQNAAKAWTLGQLLFGAGWRNTVPSRAASPASASH